MLGWTGIGRYTARLLSHLSPLAPSTEFVVLVAPGSTWEPPGDNCTVAVCDLRPYSVAERRGLGRAVARLAPDLAHFTHYNAPGRSPVPYVVTIHDLTMLRFRSAPRGDLVGRVRHEVKFRALGATMRRVVHRARHVLTPSQFVADDVAATFGVAPGRITATHLATDPPGPQSAVPPAALSAGEGPLVLHVGNFYPHKNLPALLEAAGSLLGRFPDLRLVLAGPEDAAARQLQRSAAAGPLGERAVFTGKVSEAELEWLYRQATVLVVPSRSEGFGLPGVEAMGRGLPVVAARATCLPEVYGDAAEYFDPDRPADLAAALGRVLADGGRRAELVAAGAAQQARYSWRHTAELTLACYDAALGG